MLRLKRLIFVMLIRDIRHFRRVLREFFERENWVALDTETTAKREFEGQKNATLIHGRHEPLTIQLCQKGVSYTAATNRLIPGCPTTAEYVEVLQEAEAEFAQPWWVMHNANYDLRVLRDLGWFPMPENVWDTMLGCWQADANAEKGLKARAPRLGRFIRDTKTVDMNNVEELSNYGESDVIVTDELYQMQVFSRIVRPPVLRHLRADGQYVDTKNPQTVLDLVVESEKLSDFDRFYLKNLEFPLLKTTLDIEFNGMPYDKAAMKVLREKLLTDYEVCKRQIFQTFKKVINLNSGDQLVAELQRLGIRLTRKTEKGKLSVNVEALLHLKGAHPVIDMLLNYRKLEKLLSVYMGEDGLDSFYNPETGCIHATLNQCAAVTGRYSAQQPNLQQLPARKDTYGIRSVVRVAGTIAPPKPKVTSGIVLGEAPTPSPKKLVMLKPPVKRQVAVTPLKTQKLTVKSK